MNPLLLTDFYKVGHPFQYPEKTTLVYSNLTARKSRIEGCDHVVFFGLQYFLEEYLVARFQRDFFDRPEAEVVDEYESFISATLGPLPSVEHIRQLHRLGYLPVEIRALKEGERVPIRVPVLTIHNTKREFYWVTNFLETLMSSVLWQPCTSATIADLYRKKLGYWAAKTGVDESFVPFQAHDFSMRGMSSPETAMLSGMAHLLSFAGTDTIPGILGLQRYYGASVHNEVVGVSVAATEHSVMCAGGKEDEIGTFERLLDIYPSGILSVVSDTWDLWRVLTEYLPVLKGRILERNGKLVIRPDSGDPVKILCGDPHADAGSPAGKGVVELLWDVFGGSLTETGHKMLDPHIGAIYGDSITLDRMGSICRLLHEKGFASQVVFGVGSFTYQYNTRDTLGFAVKATYVEIDGAGREIFKDPATDDGTKKSATGLLQVVRTERGLRLVDQVGWELANEGELAPVFRDGKILRRQTLGQIRLALRSQSPNS